MFSIAICDDEPKLCTQIEEYLKPYIESGHAEVEVFFSGEALYEKMRHGVHYDLIFLDIELHLMNGVHIGRKIRDELKNEKTQIVYISAKQEYAMELFAVRPMNFLIKPVSSEALFENVDKAMALSDVYVTCFEYTKKGQVYRIPYGDIMYFESRNRKIYLYTKNGIHEFYGKLSSAEKELPPDFLRTHQSFIVNKLYVTRWKYDEVLLGDETSIPVSKAYRKSINHFFMQI